MKYIFYIAALFAATSCFNGIFAEYTLQSSFEYNFAEEDKVFDSDSSFWKYSFSYGDLAFFNTNESESRFIGGFALSKAHRANVSNVPLAEINEFAVYGTSGAGKSKTFVVFHENFDPNQMPAHDIGFASAALGTCTMLSCSVNNTALTVAAIQDEASGNKFSDGDYLKLKATGYLSGAVTGEAEITLAECKEGELTYIKDWTNFSLAALGNVEYVDFTFDTSKASLKRYVCIDDVMANIRVEEKK